jgi:hypothetical protein
MSIPIFKLFKTNETYTLKGKGTGKVKGKIIPVQIMKAYMGS